MSVAIKVARASSQGGIPRGRAVRGGDPGLFGFLGNIAKKAVAFIPGVGPIASAAIGAVSGALGGRGGGRQPAGLVPLPPRVNLPVFGPAGVGASFGESFAPAAAGTKGFHLNKSSYFLRDGTFVAEGTRMVKNRRRNALNARALRRAVSRIDAGKIWQGKLAEISTAKFTAAGKHKHHH